MDSMYCNNCGKEILPSVQFCLHCGAAVSGSNAASGDFNKKPISRKVLLILAVIFGGLLVAAIISALAGGVELMATVINWLLGLLFGLSVLAIIPGIIIAIIFWSKASAEPAPRKSYHHSIAGWAFGGPLLLIVSIILSYVILNVVVNLLRN